LNRIGMGSMRRKQIVTSAAGIFVRARWPNLSHSKIELAADMKHGQSVSNRSAVRRFHDIDASPPPRRPRRAKEDSCD
jgi:hypothetical protein